MSPHPQTPKQKQSWTNRNQGCEVMTGYSHLNSRKLLQLPVWKPPALGGTVLIVGSATELLQNQRGRIKPWRMTGDTWKDAQQGHEYIHVTLMLVYVLVDLTAEDLFDLWVMSAENRAHPQINREAMKSLTDLFDHLVFLFKRRYKGVTVWIIINLKNKKSPYIKKSGWLNISLMIPSHHLLWFRPIRDLPLRACVENNSQLLPSNSSSISTQMIYLCWLALEVILNCVDFKRNSMVDEHQKIIIWKYH